jgi:hypothetical protein
VAAEDSDYLVGRFLHAPLAHRLILGLFGPDERVEGHVVVEPDGDRALVCDCRVNAERLDEATAIALVADHLAEWFDLVAVPTPPASDLAAELRAIGFLHRPPDEADERLHLSAWWDARHPAANALRRLESWSLYTGAADG